MTAILTSAMFYLFATLLLASAAMVVFARNPVHSVLFLILSFFNAAGLFVLIGAEYLAMTLVIVYVGAVAVLFLFVVMMLDINFAEMRQGFVRYLWLGLGVGGIILAEMLLIFYRSLGALPDEPKVTDMAEEVSGLTNTPALGNVLYTDYVYAFQLSGLILLVAMVGAIVLTLRQRPGVRRQNIERQAGRKRKDAVAVVKVKPGQGI